MRVGRMRAVAVGAALALVLGASGGHAVELPLPGPPGRAQPLLQGQVLRESPHERHGEVRVRIHEAGRDQVARTPPGNLAASRHVSGYRRNLSKAAIGCHPHDDFSLSSRGLRTPRSSRSRPSAVTAMQGDCRRRSSGSDGTMVQRTRKLYCNVTSAVVAGLMVCALLPTAGFAREPPAGCKSLAFLVLA
jgi:hypothetical protein